MRLFTLDRSTVLYGFQPAEEGDSRSTAGEGIFDGLIELSLRLQDRQIQAGIKRPVLGQRRHPLLHVQVDTIQVGLTAEVGNDAAHVFANTLHCGPPTPP
jgi:hypothetical protein